MDAVSIEVDINSGYELNINSDEICRNCLAKNCQLKSLFRFDIIDGEICALPKVYQSVTNIEIIEGDDFPKNICTKCESTLFEAFIFKQKSAKSHRLLKKILNIHNECPQPIDSEQLMTQQQSQFTDTPPQHEESDTLLPETCEIDEYKIELGCTEVTQNDETETIGEEGDVENWEMDYDSNVDIRDNVIHERIELIELVERIAEEDEDYEEEEEEEDMSSQSNEIQTKRVIDCETCGQKVSKHQQSSHLKQHAKIFPFILNTMDFFRCNRCQMVFLSIDSLFEHLNDDNGCEEIAHINDEVCTDYQYLNHDSPIRLLTASKNIDDNIFSCGQCILDFDDLALFQSHIEENHLSNFDCTPEYLRVNSAHLCGNCHISFKTLYDAIHHIYFHQSAFECFRDGCTHIFNSFAGLYSHFTSDHPEFTAECPHCSYVATSREDLKMHQRKACKARNIKCDFCDKTFFKKSTLNMHMRSHTNNRKYPCTLCPKAFLQNNDLANHMRTHTLERPFKCFECDKSFKTVGQRIGHMVTHSTEHNFQCDICHKTFKSARILRGHKRIHDERQFNCELCEKKFNRRYHLTIHMKRHEKPPSKKKKGAKN